MSEKLAGLQGILAMRTMLVLTLMWWSLRCVEAYNELNKFLIVSSSVTHEVAYAPIPQEPSTRAVKLRQLIGSGLEFPQGLAVDQWRRNLYIADPALGNLIFYVLEPDGERLYVGGQKIAATRVKVRWVSCDAEGNVYFTVEDTQSVMRITNRMLDSGNAIPEVVFDGSKSTHVSAPGGIAIDNYFVYWVNKLDPTKAGTLIKAEHEPNSTTRELSKIDVKTFGVCTAVNNIFFTTEKNTLYGAPRLGGITPVAITDKFQEARGCVYDGKNTVYVADKKLNGVYSFPANMQTLRESVPISLVASMQGAYGLAVYSVSQSGYACDRAAGLLPVLLLVFALSIQSQ